MRQAELSAIYSDEGEENDFATDDPCNAAVAVINVLVKALNSGAEITALNVLITRDDGETAEVSLSVADVPDPEPEPSPEELDAEDDQ